MTEGLLYRRGSFNGTFDELILRALLKEKQAEIAFSPGFRWGTTLCPGEPITLEHLMDQTAITYPNTTLNELSGAQIKAILEDVADNVFHADPYLQQGGDMVRGRNVVPARAEGENRPPHLGAGDRRQAVAKHKALQSGRVGAGRRRYNGRAHLGRGRAVFARHRPCRRSAQQPRLAGTNPSPNMS